MCDKCHKIIDKKYHICYNCKFNKLFNICKTELSDNYKETQETQEKPQIPIEPVSEYYYNMIQEL